MKSTQTSTNKIITRFAPSPTGELHIGGARTALFSYLYAKHQSGLPAGASRSDSVGHSAMQAGEFLLRIEDTDRERFVEGSSERIVESLKWLGIMPDNLDNIVYQSKRLETYQKFALQLIKQDQAYVCTCSKEQLEKDREEQNKEGKPPKYSGRCRNNNQDTRNPPPLKLRRAGKIQTNLKFQIPNNAVVRMKMPESGKIIVDDLVRGKVEFDLSLFDDQVILKSDGFPTYHLASVVDDHEMGVTDVIRSEEWLPSTPKHLILYKYLGWTPPRFAHLPMILASDRSKLSKRHGATAVLDYKSNGYLPEALVNYIAFLGWNPKSTEESFTLSELIKEFKIENVNKAGAIFDIEKLNDVNAEKIKNKISKIKNIEEFNIVFKDFGISNIAHGEMELIKRGGYKTLKEAAEYIIKLRKTPEYESSLLVFKKSSPEATIKGLKGVLGEIKGIMGEFRGESSGVGDRALAGEESVEIVNQTLNDKGWQEEWLQQTLKSVVDENQLTNGDVFWPVRVALSGEEKSPSPVELFLALGRGESVKRIERAVEKLT